MDDKLTRGGIVAAVAGLLLLLAGWGSGLFTADLTPVIPVPPKPLTPEEKVEQALAKAERAATAAAEEHVRTIRRFFDDRAGGADKFVEKATSLEGGWQLLSGKLGLGGADDHARYLKAAFEGTLFTAADVEQVVTRAVEEYRRQLAGIDERFLADLRHDVPDSHLFADDRAAGADPAPAFEAEYARLIELALPAIEKDLVTAAGTTATAQVLGDGVAWWLFHLGRQAGQSGVVGMPVALAGMAVGYVIEHLLDWVLEQFGWHPKADLAAAVRTAVDRVRDTLVAGDGADRPGLARQLAAMADTHARVRRGIARHALAVPQAPAPPESK